MAHFSYIKSGGNWTAGDSFSEAEIELLDAQLFAAVNGDAGGTWSPTGPIVIGGGAAGGMTITLSGGATPNFPTFGATATFQREYPLAPAARLYPGGFVVSTAGAAPIIRGTATGLVFGSYLDLRHDATLTSLILYTQITTGHGALPTLPQAILRRFKLSDGSFVDLLSTGVSNFPTPANVAAYEAANAWQSVWVITPDQNNIVDRTQYLYYLVVTDESGGNALPGNQWSAVRATYTTTNFQER